MFESLKNLDTLKTQIFVGIITGIIIMLLLFIPRVMAGTTGNMYNANVTATRIWNISRWILFSCALALLILGGLNVYKGFIGHGLTGIFFGLSFLIGFAYIVDMFWHWVDPNINFCLSTHTPFGK